MPRGHRKRGQFAFKIWYPTGESMSFDSTKDLDPDAWVAEASRFLHMLLESVDRYHERKEKS